jgi:hypothetical protein
LRFESRAEIPETQAGIHFALTQLLIQELRRAERQTGFALQVDAAPSGSRTRDKPALVERATRNGERSSFELGKLAQRRVGFHHHRADRRRVGVVFECSAQRSLPGDPKPVHDSDIDGPAIESDLARFGRSKFLNAEIKPILAGQPMARDNVKLPGESAGLLDPYPQGLRVRALADYRKQ